MMLTVSIPQSKTPFKFRTLKEAGMWLSSFGGLEDNIKGFKLKEISMEKNESLNFVTVLLQDAYMLRLEWGDDYFPVHIQRQIKNLEKKYNFQTSPSLKDKTQFAMDLFGVININKK